MPQRGWNKDGEEGIYLMEGELNQKVPHLVVTRINGSYFLNLLMSGINLRDSN